MMNDEFYSKDLPRWKPTDKYYPQKMVQTFKCRDLFKEGGDDKPDQIHISVSTIYKGKEFYERSVLYRESSTMCKHAVQYAINQLKTNVRLSVERYKRELLLKKDVKKYRKFSNYNDFPM